MERQGSERGWVEDSSKIPVKDDREIIPVTDDKGVPEPEVPMSPEDLASILREQEQRRKRKYKKAGNN